MNESVNRSADAGTTAEIDCDRAIGPVVRQFVEVMKDNSLTFREATLIFREARAKAFPHPRDHS